MNSSSNLTELPFAVFENLLMHKCVLLYLGFWNRKLLKSFAHWFGLVVLARFNLKLFQTISFKGRFPGCMRNLFSTMFCFSFNAMYLGRNNGNISETKKRFLSQRFLKIRKVLLDMRKGFLIMSNFYLVEIPRESNNIAIVKS